MTTDFLGGAAAELAAANPAEPVKTSVSNRKRIPMSVPTRKLVVPEIPGFKLRWVRGTEGRLNQALQAGYTFVGRGEVALLNADLAGSSAANGNTDLGDRVSVASGDEVIEGNSVRLYLMKLPQGYWDEDEMAEQARQAETVRALRGQGIEGKGEDNSNRYVPKDAGNSNIFQPHRRS